MPLTTTRMILIVAIALAVSGCGLSAYEDEMGREQKRVNYLDEQDRLLGKPVEFSQPEATKEEDKSKSLPDIFVRLPKEVSSQGKPLVAGRLLYRFAGPDDTEKGFKDVYIAAITQKKDFRPDVLLDMQQLLNYTGDTNYKQEVIKPLEGQPLTFETLSFLQPSKPPLTFHVYYYRENKVQVLIIYIVVDEKEAGQASIQRTIQMSLETLGVGNAALQKRLNFRSRAG